MRISDVLADKGNQVHTANPNQTVQEVIRALVQNNVGALCVVDQAGQLVGIFTERDTLRLVDTHASQLATLTVGECMTKKVMIARPDDSVDQSLMLMTSQRIRHLPVVESGKLIGVVPQGDLVKAKLEVAEFVTRHLTDFITGKYPA